MRFQQSPDLARSELKKRVGMMATNRNEMPHDSHSTTGQSWASQGMLAISSGKDIVNIVNMLKKSWVLHKGTGERRKNAASTSLSTGRHSVLN